MYFSCVGMTTLLIKGEFCQIVRITEDGIYKASSWMVLKGQSLCFVTCQPQILVVILQLRFFFFLMIGLLFVRVYLLEVFSFPNFSQISTWNHVQVPFAERDCLMLQVTAVGSAAGIQSRLFWENLNFFRDKHLEQNTFLKGLFNV